MPAKLQVLSVKRYDAHPTCKAQSGQQKRDLQLRFSMSKRQSVKSVICKAEQFFMEAQNAIELDCWSSIMMPNRRPRVSVLP